MSNKQLKCYSEQLKYYHETHLKHEINLTKFD